MSRRGTMHSKLAPSSAYRWANCPASLADNSRAGKAAEEGTKAHELAYKMLTGEEYSNYPADMVNHVSGYVEYIKTLEGTKYYEAKVDIFDKCFGTADAVVTSWNKIHVIDLKYGKSVPVPIENNKQLLLYAWGAYRELWTEKDDPHLIRITIYQPRTPDQLVKSQQLKFSDLMDFIDDMKVRAKEALQRNKKVPGSWCIYCQVCKGGNACAWT
jgi:hypothetical protein